ncbi:hypothetical protein LCGC14_1632750 [marine sediment metagenome]|uniref:Uncharacterized protein n=1 Tax=marine sediment metagenome TaxID=412755 RepID=A0A0F9I2E2_9ZZZZ
MTTLATRLDGLPYEISWRGQSYLVPSSLTLNRNISLGIYKNPAEETVHPESSDSWFQLLGLLPPLDMKK